MHFIGEFSNEALLYTDEEFLEYISSKFKPYLYWGKKSSTDIWTLQPFAHLTPDEKKQHWLEFKKPYDDQTRARAIYAQVLSRNDEKNALLDLHVELRHKLRNMPPPLQEPYTEDMRLDHEWKHMNKGKDYKQYFQARMRRDDDIGDRNFQSYRNPRDRYFEDIHRKKMLEAITEDQVIAMDRTRKSQYIALQKFRGQNPHEYLPDRICSTFFNEEEVGLKLLKQEEKKELERNIKRNLNKSFDYNPIVVDGSVLLQDVINGFYTMENIALAKNGHFDADGTAERSVLKLLDNVLTYSRKRTHDILQPHEDPRQFFKSLQQSGIDIENLRPVQLDQCVESAATAIDLMISTRAEPNEVEEACEFLMKAQIMYEAEVNLRKVVDISDWKRLQILMYQKSMDDKMKEYDEAMAKLGIRPAIDETLDKDSEMYKVAAAAEAKWFRDQENAATLHRLAHGVEQQIPGEDYDIYMKYDLSLLPSDDPNVYKPLEIISYIGLTRPNQEIK